jgi:hypothetical protein
VRTFHDTSCNLCIVEPFSPTRLNSGHPFGKHPSSRVSTLKLPYVRSPRVLGYPTRNCGAADLYEVSTLKFGKAKCTAILLLTRYSSATDAFNVESSRTTKISRLPLLYGPQFGIASLMSFNVETCFELLPNFSWDNDARGFKKDATY